MQPAVAGGEQIAIREAGDRPDRRPGLDRAGLPAVGERIGPEREMREQHTGSVADVDDVGVAPREDLLEAASGDLDRPEDALTGAIDRAEVWRRGRDGCDRRRARRARRDVDRHAEARPELRLVDASDAELRRTLRLG